MAWGHGGVQVQRHEGFSAAAKSQACRPTGFTLWGCSASLSPVMPRSKLPKQHSDRPRLLSLAVARRHGLRL